MKGGDKPEIIKMFNRLSSESENIVNTVISLCYFMRGSISYDDMMFRTPGERDLISTFIDKRLNQEKDKMYQVY